TQGDVRVQQAFDHNNQRIQSKSHIETQYQQDKQTVHNELQHAADKGEGIGTIDARIKENVNSSMQENHAQLEQKKSELQQGAEPLKDRVDEKVKGQVIGSIDPAKGSLLDNMKHPDEGLFHFVKDAQHE
ncbi:MAG TPA: hypothetical protein VFF04_03955, partial [Candidatus Babeliales bacterium]|nr:hypothetical protein [Candidatus Babeliales bacterium]